MVTWILANFAERENMGILEFFVEIFDFLLKITAVMMVLFVAALIVITDESVNSKRILLAIALVIGSMYFIFS